MTMNKEVRTLLGHELRAVPGEFSIVGRAVKYNSLSQNLGGFKEIIAPGCFTLSLADKSQDVFALVNHEYDRLLGRLRSGTLTLTDGPDALRFKVQLDKDSPDHQSVYSSVKRGDLSECSFQFGADKAGDLAETWDRSTDPPTRTVTRAKLYDVSVVLSPAYANGATVAEARAHRFPISGSNLDNAIKMLRRAAQIVSKEIRAQRGEMDQNDFASIGGHMQLAHELCEAACAVSGTARAIMDAYDDDDSISDELRSLKETHGVAHKALDVACDRCAATRLAHSSVADKLGRKKK